MRSTHLCTAAIAVADVVVVVGRAMTMRMWGSKWPDSDPLDVRDGQGVK